MKGKCSLKMKKIALVKWSIDRTDGGLKVATSLANELSTMYEVHLLSMISTENNFFSLKQSVRYQNLSSKKISMSKNFLEAVKLLRNYLKEENIDIVFGITRWIISPRYILVDPLTVLLLPLCTWVVISTL